MRTELVVATYRNPRALRLSLVSAACQRLRPDAICIADDGSGPETAAVVAVFRAEHPGWEIRHVWHQDRGFEKNAILNRAVATSSADFLVFIDGDVMIHSGFVARHLAIARPDRFASGSLIRLGPEASAAVTEADVTSGRVFDRAWLRAQGALRRPGAWAKAMPWPMPVQAALDRLSLTRRNWCGSNASAFRAAILGVNGFDETMKWGGEDKDLGVRLANAGVRGRHIRFTAPAVHLHHAKGYADRAVKAGNLARIAEARRSRRSWTPDGIEKGAP
jgi:glycosyltransferase involved in cell wall biosynthesis